jgi:O-antigen/teichoic acid export membrane protein
MILKKLKQGEKHQGFIRYFRNTSWMVAEQFLRIIAGLFVGIWVARYLGPAQFGLFSYALAFSAIFGGVAKLGLDGIVVRELVNHPENRDIYLGTAFWLKVIGSFIVMGLIAGAVPFASNDSQTNLYIFIIASGLIFQSFEVVEFYFQSQVMAKIVSICKVVQLALSSAIKIYLVLNQAELLYFVLITAFDALTLAVSYNIGYRLSKDHPPFYKHFDLSIAKQLLKDSWPLIFSSIVVMIYMRSDQIMIKEMVGEYEVGIYSAAVRLSEVFHFLPMLITASLFPAILNAKKKSEALYIQRLQSLYTLMVWMAIGIALPMTFLSDWLSLFLYGQAYQAAGQVLIVHIWASIFVFLGVASGKWFLAENLVLMTFFRTLFGLAVNIAINLALIPRYGGFGAAVSTLAAQICATYLFDIFNRKTREMFLLKTRAFYLRGFFNALKTK